MGKRYLCERCGTGSIAPARMAPDDIRRYCLDCSKATGKLVELICPSRERAKARTQQRAAEKRQREREKEVNAKYIMADGSDVRPIFKRIQALETWKNEGPEVRDRIRGLKLKHAPEKRMDADSYALGVISNLAGVAASVITAHEQRRYRQRHSRFDAARQSLIRSAGVECFGLDDTQLLQVLRTTMRLRYGADAEKKPTDWEPAIRQLIAAKGAQS